MSKTTSYAMYPHSVIGFGFAIDGFKLFAHLEAKAFKTKLCVHTSCGVALPDTQGVSSGRFLRAERLFMKSCNRLWTDHACLRMLLHASLIPVQKQHLLVCKLGIHVRAVRQKTVTRQGEKRLQQAGPGTNLASLGGLKTGSGFLHEFNFWATWWTQFWVQISTPEMGPQNAKKGTSLLFEGFRCGALPGVKFCAVYPNELATALPSG